MFPASFVSPAPELETSFPYHCTLLNINHADVKLLPYYSVRSDQTETLVKRGDRIREQPKQAASRLLAALKPTCRVSLPVVSFASERDCTSFVEFRSVSSPKNTRTVDLRARVAALYLVAAKSTSVQHSEFPLHGRADS